MYSNCSDDPFSSIASTLTIESFRIQSTGSHLRSGIKRRKYRTFLVLQTVWCPDMGHR